MSGGPTDPPDWAKDDKGKAQRAFETARIAKAQKQIDSQQVKQAAPGMKPTPNGPMRAGPDRHAHQNAMNNDNNRAKEERARQLAESIRKDKERQSEKAKDKDRER